MTTKKKNLIFPKLNIFSPEIKEELQKILMIPINNIAIYEQAFTHSSYLVANKNIKSNERLEFLGDAVLELIVSKYLFEFYTDKNEGQLTEIRSHLVNKETLSNVFEKLNIKKFLILSYGAEKSCGRNNITISADVIEALIAAIYLDSGILSATKFVKKHIIYPVLENINLACANYKKELQEIVQERNKILPEYKVLEESGLAHDRTFTVGVFLNKKQIGAGTGKTKKNAEQNAAAEALKLFI